jgi:hypothetical protein
MDTECRIDLLKIREDGLADWLGCVNHVEKAQPKLNQLSLSSDDHFLAIDRATRTVVAHVVGKHATS